jgi:hypothetical protein
MWKVVYVYNLNWWKVLNDDLCLSLFLLKSPWLQHGIIQDLKEEIPEGLDPARPSRLLPFCTEKKKLRGI